MKNAQIDFSTIKSPNDFYGEIKKILNLPEYFSYNLDSLYDCLTDIFEPVSISFSNCKEGNSSLGGYFNSIKQVFADAKDAGSRVESVWNES